MQHRDRRIAPCCCLSRRRGKRATAVDRAGQREPDIAGIVAVPIDADPGGPGDTWAGCGIRQRDAEVRDGDVALRLFDIRMPLPRYGLGLLL